MRKSYVVDRGLMEALEKRSKPISCSDGRILFSQGELPSGLYILRTGEAALLAARSSGEEVECLRVTASSLLGLDAARVLRIEGQDLPPHTLVYGSRLFVG
jgi:CRP-like cAMP-binding protein